MLPKFGEVLMASKVGNFEAVGVYSNVSEDLLSRDVHNSFEPSHLIQNAAVLTRGKALAKLQNTQ